MGISFGFFRLVFFLLVGVDFVFSAIAPSLVPGNEENDDDDEEVNEELWEDIKDEHTAWEGRGVLVSSSSPHVPTGAIQVFVVVVSASVSTDAGRILVISDTLVSKES